MAKNDFFDTPKHHTLLKLKVLEKYLQTYAEIMGRVYKSIAFIDAYAGIGKYKDKQGNEYNCSPIIMLNALKRILSIENGKCQIAKYYANDLDADRCRELSSILSSDNDLYEVHQKEAKKFISECLLNVCPRYGSILFFIDPFNYSILKEDIDNIFTQCSEFYSRGQSEVILFLPISNIYRFKAMNENKTVVNFIESYGIDLNEDTDTDKFVERIRNALAGRDKYCASVKLKEGANTYALFFIGKHIYGVDKFMEARDKCLNQDTNMELFILPETPLGLLKSKIEKTPMFNWEIYEWAMRNNISALQIKNMVKQLEIKENLMKNYINCKPRKGTYYLNHNNWADKSKMIKYFFEGK